MKLNAMLLCDFYKIGHRVQYPDNTERVYSTWTPRSGKHLPGVDKVVVFGIQGFIIEYLIEYFNDNFFKRPLDVILKEYTRVIKNTLFVTDPYTKHIEGLHELGYMPLHIKALDEGTRVPFRTPILTMENTDDRFFWLTNYMETLMSNTLWKPSTTASIAYQYRQIMDKWALKTTGSNAGVEFQGHDFSMRGQSGLEDAARSGVGHLTSFVGTDTIPAILYAEQYYGANVEKELVGCSVNASEHSVMCAGGKDDEYETYRRLVQDVYPTGIVSLVSDTWDLWHVLTDTIPRLKDIILARDGGVDSLDKVVVRPDCYDEDTQILTPKGWVHFKYLSCSDKVAQVLDDGTHEFVNYTNYIEQEYSGDMCHFYDNHGKMDLLVTPNHRMIYDKKGKEFVQEAHKFGDRGYHNKNIVRSAASKSMGLSLSPMERLKIMFQADGSYTTTGGKIRASFSKQRKIDRLENILKDADIEYKIYNLGDGRKEFNINTSAHNFVKDFSWVDMDNMCSDWCKSFIEELSYWDATRRSTDRFKFDTTTEGVIDVVEMVCINAGYGILISTNKDTREKHFSDVYTAHILKNNHIGGQSIKKNTVQYDGKIHCVTVPTGRLLVKRNRCTAVCGNSGDPADIICGISVEEFTLFEDAEEHFNDDVYEKAGEECEGSYNCGKREYINYCTVGGFAYKFTTIVDYGRHDKQFYFVENTTTSWGETTLTPEQKGVVELLWDTFSGTTNSQGYKVLNPCIGAIYGDSITPERCTNICSRLADKGFASTNVVFGIGSYTYQYITRDSLGYAMKATSVTIDDDEQAIFKDPITDDGIKKSAKGKVRVIQCKSGIKYLDDYDSELPDDYQCDLLKTVFRDGTFGKTQSLSEIRNKLSEDYT